MAVTITFKNLGVADSLNTQTEGPFDYRMRAGASGWDYDNAAGNPASSLASGFAAAASGDFEFFRNDVVNGLFFLTSFDYQNTTPFGSQSDTLDFVALNGVTETFLCSVSLLGGGLATNNSCGTPNFLMDHLFIRVSNPSTIWLNIDNINLNGEGIPVPEPASMLLLGAGLFGVVARSRKRQA